LACEANQAVRFFYERLFLTPEGFREAALQLFFVRRPHAPIVRSLLLTLLWDAHTYIGEPSSVSFSLLQSHYKARLSNVIDYKGPDRRPV